MKYKIILCIIFCGVVVFNDLKAQEQLDSVNNISLTTIAQAHQGNSYITFLEGVGKIDHLWFEANLIPSFYIRVREDSRLLGVLTPQVILRMYQEESFPVRTPSYMPQITVYYSLYNKNKCESLNLFGRIAHHSNGQQGDFFLTDGSINLKSGDFSTNYIEAGFVKTSTIEKFNAVKMIQSSVQIHPPSISATELDGIYSFYRWNNFIYIFKLNKSDNEFNKSRKANISLKTELNWVFGDLNNSRFLDFNRLTFATTFTYHPLFFEDIVLFAQYYYGKDYYNMYFSNTLSVFRVGIMTELIRF
ncbi:MAG TPA: hypothetical protein P5132_06260 [Bacteroidales bacterium]|nr:hypothetical protein [Bacteroidales bacterium]